MKKRKKENHKYIGFHNQKEVVSVFGPNKSFAEGKCKELLLGYFHDLQDNVTRFPLDYYNGVVAYVGSKVVKKIHFLDLCRLKAYLKAYLPYL